MRQYSFSNFRKTEFEVLHQNLSEVFLIGQDKLYSLYEVMQSGFEIEGYPEQTLNRDIFRSSDQNFQKCYNNAWVIGVDIPSIFERIDKVWNQKTIVIVGQEPQRRSDKRIEEISLATPYALHLKSCREQLPRTRLYFEMLEVFLEQGYRVYLTDVFKIWVSKSDNGFQKISLPRQDCERFIKVLRLELAMIQPLAVISWGRVASYIVSNIGLTSTKHLKFPHPSSAANGTWQKLIGKPPTKANRIEFWKSKVFNDLERL